MKLASSTSEPTLPCESGGFRLLEELGRGGMGVVYRAQETASGRVVALKVLARDLVVSDEAFQRFQREARVAAAISDRNCVFVFGAHDLEGAPAIAMELCTGETLQERLQRGEPVPIADAVRWTMQILEGLEAANEAGILHRDVKPSNCFLTESGDVKVGDFGLSKVLETDIGLTRSGAFLGSPLFASPEQARGRPLDLRSDLYSVGATLYALLTGRAPYSGTSMGEVLARILSEDPDPPRSLRPEIPRGLEKIVLKAMARQPERRYADHEAFRRALEPYLEAGGRPVGLARRFVAYLIDTTLISIATMGFMFGSLALGHQLMDPERPYLMKAWWLNLVLGSSPILYSGLMEGLWGASLGKWLTGVRIVARNDLQPSLGRAFVRALLFHGWGIAITLFLHAFHLDAELGLGWTVGQLVAATVPWMMMVVMMSTARRRNGWLGIHGKLSGTLAIESPSVFEDYLPTGDELGEAALRDGVHVPDAVGSLAVAGDLGATPSGRFLLARDPALERSVWIHESAPGLEFIGDHRRSSGRPARLHWLGGVDVDGHHYDMFEAPGGVALLDYVARSGALRWMTTRRWLLDLAEELAHEDGGHARHAVEQLWIDRAGRLRLLDAPLGERPVTMTALELLSATAVQLAPRDEDGRPRLPVDLPVHAEPTLRRLLGLDPPFVDVASALTEIRSWKRKPGALMTRTRGTQVALSTAVPVFMALAFYFSALFGVKMIRDVGEGIRAARELARNEAVENSTTARLDLPEIDEPAERPEPLTEDGVRARRLLIADALSTFWGPFLEQQLQAAPEAQSVVREVRASAPPTPTPEEVSWALAEVADPDEPPVAEQAMMILLWSIPVVPLICSLFWGVACVLTTLIAGCGLSFRFTGLRLRTGTGEHASRVRCAWRSMLTWGPSGVLFAAGVAAMGFERPVVMAVATGLGAVVLLIGLVITIAPNKRSLQDRIAGTWIVPL